MCPWQIVANVGIGMEGMVQHCAFCVDSAPIYDLSPVSGGDSSSTGMTGTVDDFLMFSIVLSCFINAQKSAISEGGKVFVDPDAQSLEPLLDNPSRATITSFLQLGSR